MQRFCRDAISMGAYSDMFTRLACMAAKVEAE
jgi:hypothetical protein